MIHGGKKIFKIGDKIFDMSLRHVMGIINVSPDSFYKGSRYTDEQAVLHRVEQILDDGASMIDVGGMSTRPGAAEISVKEELARLLPAIRAIKKEFPDVVVSVDTYRHGVLEPLIDQGVGLVNDISGGALDHGFLDFVAERGLPYILMHMHGTPRTMQLNPSYDDVVLEVLTWFSNRLYALRQKGIYDVIVDPGFGFGKSVVDNYSLLKGLEAFKILDSPIMVGLSRKSMIYKVLDATPENALNGTTAAHILALQGGATMLRVHDVKAAAEAIKIYEAFENA